MEDIFGKVKEANEISAVMAEAGIQLKGTGRYLRWSEHKGFVVDVHGQCFFKNSEHPTWLNEDQGDVITFVQGWKRTDAKGAVEYLCRMAGFEEPNWGEGDGKARISARAREDAYTIAARVFVRRLRADVEAQDYVLSRGWTEETIKKAGLGFTGWGGAEERKALISEFNMHGIPPDSPGAVLFLGYEGKVLEWMDKHGLDIPTDWVTKDRLYGLPKGMLVYPHVEGGRVRYVSLRAIKEKRHHNIPVVIAGPRRVFFNQVYSPNVDQCVVVEGQADAITLGQWGIPAVALAGVAKDADVLATLKKRHSAMYVGVDRDEAGQKAIRSLGMLLGPLSRVIRWPGKQGAVNDANDWLQWMLEQGEDYPHEVQVEQAEYVLGMARTFIEEVCIDTGKLVGAPYQEALKDTFDLISNMERRELAAIRTELTKALGLNTRDFNHILKETRSEAKEDEKRRGKNDGEPKIVETLGGYFDDWLIEVTYDPEELTTGLVYRDPNGNVGEAGYLDVGGVRYVSPEPNALMLKDVVLFPSRLGPLKSTKELIDIMQEFIHRNYDYKGDEFFERLSAYYALFTWVYDAFQVVPYLRALGDYGTGKTQMIFRLGHICYRLMKTSGASTLSPIFRIINRYRGTLFLDEADFGKSDATIEIIKLLNTGYMKGVPMLRSRDSGGGDFDIEPFDVYGPKLIATREIFQDRAVESRCLTKEVVGGPVRRSVPRILKRSFYEESLEIRNMLLAWRMKWWREEIEVDDDDFDPRIEDRLNQVTMGLKKIVNDDEMKKDISSFIFQYNNRLIMERSQSLEAKVLEALIKIRDEKPEILDGKPFWDLSMQNVARVTNEIIDDENRMDNPEAEERRQKNKKDLSPRGAGALIDKKLALYRERASSGANKGRYVVKWDEDRINSLCERFGLIRSDAVKE